MVRWLVSLLCVVMGNTVHGQGADVGLVNLVSGEVTFAPQSGPPARVQAFMKVRDGDRIDVAAGAQVRIVFFEGARQELWVGPASFRSRTSAAEPISGRATETVNLPVGVPQRMARVPELIQYAKLGGIQVRSLTRQQQESLEQQSTLANARAVYEKMRQEMPATDITPELYFYSALYEFLVYDEMKKIVVEMRRKQPENEDVKALDAWVTNRMPR
jgi:hypothetical protein